MCDKISTKFGHRENPRFETMCKYISNPCEKNNIQNLSIITERFNTPKRLNPRNFSRRGKIVFFYDAPQGAPPRRGRRKKGRIAAVKIAPEGST